MVRRPPRSTRTDTLCPDTPLVRSAGGRRLPSTPARTATVLGYDGGARRVRPIPSRSAPERATGDDHATDHRRTAREPARQRPAPRRRRDYRPAAGGDAVPPGRQRDLASARTTAGRARTRNRPVRTGP